MKRRRGSLVWKATCWMGVAAFSATLAGCGRTLSGVTTTIAGTIQGNVSVDGVPQLGVPVDLTDDFNPGTSSVNTDASGNFSFFDVQEGVHHITIGTQPPDVTWDQTRLDRTIDVDGETEVANFTGRRTLTGTFAGSILRSGGDASHDVFVFNAPIPTAAGLVITRTDDNEIEVSGPTLGPTPLPVTTGTFDPATGQYTATGSGDIAGVAGIQIDVSGTITGEVGQQKRAMLTITLGGGGGLPGGQPISYTFDGLLDDHIGP